MWELALTGKHEEDFAKRYGQALMIRLGIKGKNIEFVSIHRMADESQASFGGFGLAYYADKASEVEHAYRTRLMRQIQACGTRASP